MKKEVITITFGDAAQNHQGMEQIGQRHQRGFSLENLNHAYQYFKKLGATCKITQLHELMNSKKLPQSLQCQEAYILIVKKGLQYLLPQKKITKDLHQQLKKFEWDQKYFDTRRQRVLNKHARKNVCFGENSQQPDYENKKGRIVPWKEVPLLSEVKWKLNEMMGTMVQFQAEGNLYHDGGVKDTGVGYHGDSQRRMVVGIRTGNNMMPLHYQWFYKSKAIGNNYSVNIEPGDLYVMSQKAVGTDWKKKSILTLRHATGATKYIKL